MDGRGCDVSRLGDLVIFGMTVTFEVGRKAIKLVTNIFQSHNSSRAFSMVFLIHSTKDLILAI